jgi:hypothetical protein
LCKTSKNAICGGFTSISWGGDRKGEYVADYSAFTFNMSSKFVPSNFRRAVFVQDLGITFGCSILRLSGIRINSENGSFCCVGKNNFYDIEKDINGNSPLTGEKEEFTCTELEVYKVFKN